MLRPRVPFQRRSQRHTTRARGRGLLLAVTVVGVPQLIGCDNPDDTAATLGKVVELLAALGEESSDSPQQESGESTRTARLAFSLERVVDGDTIIGEVAGLIIGDGTGSGRPHPSRSAGPRRERVRYIGIDTPELAREGRPAEPLANKAKTRNRELLGSGPLWLTVGVQSRDRYGRLLAYVYNREGQLVNGELLREGLAEVLTIPPNVAAATSFRALEREARAAQLGLWSQGSSPGAGAGR